MITDDQKLRLLSEERASLRPAILAMQVSMHYALFAFLTISGVILGLYWNQAVITENARPTVMFAATQVQFFLFLFVIGLVAHQSVATGYIAALEVTINKFAGNDHLNVFESRISPEFYRAPLSAFGIAKALIFLFLLGLFILVGQAAVRNRLLTYVLLGEGLGLAGLLLATVTRVSRVSTYALGILKATPSTASAA